MNLPLAGNFVEEDKFDNNGLLESAKEMKSGHIVFFSQYQIERDKLLSQLFRNMFQKKKK